MKLPTWRGKLPQWNGKKPSKDAWKASLRTRSFRVGGYSVAAAAIVVVIAVVANLLVNALPAGATQFDISAGSMFTMSQETEQPGRGPQFCPGVCDGDGLQQQPDCGV